VAYVPAGRSWHLLSDTEQPTSRGIGPVGDDWLDDGCAGEGDADTEGVTMALAQADMIKTAESTIRTASRRAIAPSPSLRVGTVVV
jgi:hypothetical protein